MSTPADRLPPHNLDAERSVLGASILDPDAIDPIVSELKPSDFYRDAHGIVFAELVAMRTDGTPIDSIALEHRLRLAGTLAKAGGLEAILGLMDSVAHSASIGYHARIVREKAVARDLIIAYSEGLDRAYADASTADELLSLGESAIFAIRDARDLAEHATLPQALDAALDQIRARQGDAPLGVETGLVDLDKMIGDMLPGQLCVVGARPGMGKTALGLQAAICCAAQGRAALFASLEMDRAEIGERYLSLSSGIPGDILRIHGQMGDGFDAYMVKLEAASDVRHLAPLWIDDSPSLTVPQIAAKARRLKARHGLGLVVVDYLQLITPESGRPRDARHDEIARISRGLKSLAGYLRCPVLALAQLNRGTEHREDKRPRLADLRESGQIEQDAHKVILIHRPEVYNPTDRPGQAEMIVAKNRGGPTGSVPVNFRAPLTRFESIARHHTDADAPAQAPAF